MVRKKVFVIVIEQLVDLFHLSFRHTLGYTGFFKFLLSFPSYLFYLKLKFAYAVSRNKFVLEILKAIALRPTFGV